MSTSREIRQQFIDFFVERHGHAPVPSSPVVPLDDPTLLFANAGMNQFKDVFLGQGDRPYTRAVDTQKCIRAGGKHNDLDDVGRDTYHHTFFEMLGNWSFGDYFKAEAIDWAWELLVDVWGLDPERLHATYFEGDAADGLEPDVEARDLWLKHLPVERVHPGNKKDNFWEMGETGPCGPCSEVHYDGTPGKTGGDRVNQDDPNVIEIWNLVFIQFNRGGDGKLASLPDKHVDTGMGFERIVRVLQGVDSNYDTDVFGPIFEAIRKVTGAPAYKPGGGPEMLADANNVAYRVIADHIRTLTFAITDGAHCGNAGRDSVLRSILRRAVRFGRQQFGVEEPFFYKLVSAVVESMGDVFPEITKTVDAVTAELKEEEIAFRRTLDRGLSLFDEAAEQSNSRAESVNKLGTAAIDPPEAPYDQIGAAPNPQATSSTPLISALSAFRLYETYGFPIDLTVQMAEERGIGVDMDGYQQLFADHQEKSKGAGGAADATASLGEYVLHHDLPATVFTGYDELVTDGARVLAKLKLEGGAYEAGEDVPVGCEMAVVLDKSPFYGESGGQVGDTGYLRTHQGAVMCVTDTIRFGEVWFHLGELEAGDVSTSHQPFDGDDEVLAEVDGERRGEIMKHHTCTHVMNHKLRAVLGEHVQQRGSLVDETRTRFDFSHTGAVTVDQIAKIEAMVREDIKADLSVNANIADQEEAMKIHGLRAVFGEKYPPRVRVVSVGPTVGELLNDPDNSAWYDRSIEFCGGTHLKTTGQAEGFAIIGEESVAKGVRRLIGVAGAAAAAAKAAGEELGERLAGLESAEGEALAKGAAELATAIDEKTLPVVVRSRLQGGLAQLQKKTKAAAKEASKAASGQVVDVARQIAADSDGDVIVASVDGADGSTLRDAMDVIKKTRPEAALLLGAVSGDKIAFIASVPTEKIGQGLRAGDWVREVAKVAGGGGGGRPDMAQAGGKDPAKLGEALETARKFAASALG